MKNHKVYSSIKSLVIAGIGVFSGSVTTISFAAAGDIDTGPALGYIAGGLAAAAAVTAAMFGLVALIGAAKKAMRAGT